MKPRKISLTVLGDRSCSSASGHFSVTALHTLSLVGHPVTWFPSFFIATSDIRTLNLSAILFSLPSVLKSIYFSISSPPIITSLIAGVSLNNPEKRLGLS